MSYAQTFVCNQTTTNNLLQNQNKLLHNLVKQSTFSPLQCSTCKNYYHSSAISFCIKCKKTICETDSQSGCCHDCHKRYFKGFCTFTSNNVETQYSCQTCKKTFCFKHLHTLGQQTRAYDQCSDFIEFSKHKIQLNGNCMNCHDNTRYQGNCSLCPEGSINRYKQSLFYNCFKCKREFCHSCKSKNMNISNERYQIDNICKDCEPKSWSSWFYSLFF